MNEKELERKEWLESFDYVLRHHPSHRLAETF
jgi:hypothetical protein